MQYLSLLHLVKIIVETQKYFETTENIFKYLLGVVPGEAIVEEVVQQRHAGLVAEAVLLEDAVGLLAAAGAGGGPAVELAAVEDVGGAHGGQGRRPEPAVDVVGLEPEHTRVGYWQTITVVGRGNPLQNNAECTSTDNVNIDDSGGRVLLLFTPSSVAVVSLDKMDN